MWTRKKTSGLVHTATAEQHAAVARRRQYHRSRPVCGPAGSAQPLAPPPPAAQRERAPDERGPSRTQRAQQERPAAVRRRALRPRLRRCWVQRRLVSHRRHLQGRRGAAQAGRLRRRAALSGPRVFVIRRQQQSILGFEKIELHFV